MLREMLSSVVLVPRLLVKALGKIPLPFRLLGVIAFVFIFGSSMPEFIARFFYTFSLLFKTLLLAFLPFMLFAFIFNGIVAFRKGATIVLLVLLGSVFLSDIFIALFTYAVGRMALPTIVESMIVQATTAQKVLEPLIPLQVIDFRIDLEKVLLISIAFGIFFSFFKLPKFEHVMAQFKGVIEKILKYIFVPLLPLYVFGFLLEIQHKGIFTELFRHYGMAFLLIFAIQVVYVSFFYIVVTGFSFRRGWKAIKNAFPAYLTGFSTMSSMVALPVSIDAAEKNTKNRPLAEMSMPIMANLHFMGIATHIPILSMATMLLFQGGGPAFYQYLNFVVVLCYTMIAISGVPGSGILLMAPLLKSHFSFSPEMVSVVTAIYLLIEPFGTAANVFGDGALVIVVNKIVKKLGLARG